MPSIVEITKLTGRTFGIVPPKYNEEGMARELVQVSRLSYAVSSVNGATGAIAGCIAVFNDPDSSPEAKAASVMRSVSRVIQMGGLLPGGYGGALVLVSTLIDLVTSIVDATAPQIEPLFDRLETLMRQLEGEAVANEVVASRKMIARQISALNTLDDRSASFQTVLAYAPITSGISQFMILSANEWLIRKENQNNPIWDEVFNCHVAAVTQLQALLLKIRRKIDPDDKGYKAFLAIEETINADIWSQCVQLGERINKSGQFVHLGLENHWAYRTSNLDKPWIECKEHRYRSLALFDDMRDEGVRGWACHTGHDLSVGDFAGHTTLAYKEPLGSMEVEIAPARSEQDQYTLLVIVRDEPAHAGRLLALPIKKPLAGGDADHDGDMKRVEWLKDGWQTGFRSGHDDFQMVKPFTAAVGVAGTADHVSKGCVYLVMRSNMDWHLGYIERDALDKGKSLGLELKNPMRIGGGRIAVSEGMVFFPSLTAGTIDYCTHDVFVNGANGGGTGAFDRKTHGSLQVMPNGRPDTATVRDIFACSDDHLLVVLDSGDMWNVVLEPTKSRTRDVNKDKWIWRQQMQGSAERIAWVPSLAVYNWTSLRDMVRKALPVETTAQ